MIRAASGESSCLSLIQWVSFIARHKSAKPDYLQVLRHLSSIHESNRTGYVVQQRKRHFIRGYRFRSGRVLGAEYLPDPILAVLRFGHLQNILKNNVALTRRWSPDQKRYSEVR